MQDPTVQEDVVVTPDPTTGTEEEATTPASEETTTQAEPEVTEDDGVDLEGLETTSDGRVKLSVGDSVYLSKTGLKGKEAIADAWTQFRTSQAEKDRGFKEMKARTAIRPKETEVTAVDDKRPDAPNQYEIRDHTLRQYGVDPKLVNIVGNKEAWRQYKEDNNLDTEDAIDLRAKVEKAVNQADTLYQERNQRWFDQNIEIDARTNVVDMLVDAGVDPDEFADSYFEVVKRVKEDKAHRNEFGYLIPGRIEREMAKEMRRTLEPQTESKLKKKIEEKIHQVKVEKTKLKIPGSSSAKPETKPKQVGTIREAGDRLRKMIAQGQI